MQERRVVDNYLISNSDGYRACRTFKDAIFKTVFKDPKNIIKLWRFNRIESDLMNLSSKTEIKLTAGGIVEEYQHICQTGDSIISVYGNEKTAWKDSLPLTLTHLPIIILKNGNRQNLTLVDMERDRTGRGHL